MGVRHVTGLIPWPHGNSVSPEQDLPAETALGLPSPGLISVTVNISKTIVLVSSKTESEREHLVS